MKIEITRLYQVPFSNPKETLGVLYLIDDNRIIFDCKTLELPWKENRNRISCIPPGTYKCRFYNSPSKGEVLLLYNVPERSYIEIHIGNYNRDILGCIIVGYEWRDIDGDRLMDVVNSRVAFSRLKNLLRSSGQEEFELEIKWRS